MSTLRDRLVRLARENPELRPHLLPLLKKAGKPETTDIYPDKIDHGWDEPLSGGTDVMKRLQNQLRREQGLSTHPVSQEVPKAAATLPHITTLRDPYYSMGDGIVGFAEAIRGPETKNDAELKRMVREVQSLLDRIHNHLSKNYIWD